MPGGRPKSDPVSRFLKFVAKMPSGCHEWQGGMHRDGYGKFQWDGRTTTSAHRAGYLLLVGEIPDGKWVLHTCDNRRCVNPSHLFLGGSQENIDDMDAKGRRGTKCQLTEEQVAVAMRLHAAGVSQQKIADAFGVHQTAISRYKLRKTKLFKKE